MAIALINADRALSLFESTAWFPPVGKEGPLYFAQDTKITYRWDLNSGAYVQFASAGGAADHGLLTGLADDDHPQYALDTDLATHVAAADPHPGYTTTAELNAAIADPAWVDYSATSTIVGWSSFTTKKIFVKTVGNLVHVMYQIAGTSNAANATFTLPSASSASLAAIHICRVSNNSAATVAALALLPPAQNTVNFYSSSDTAAFTASGDKSVEGQFFYAI